MPETKRKLTWKQKKFADHYIVSGNATQSALKVYGKEKKPLVYQTAHSLGSENLSKPTVMEYIQSKAQDCAENIYELAKTAQNENVRLNASKDVLDRAGFKAIERSISITKDVKSFTPDEIREASYEMLGNIEKHDM